MFEFVSESILNSAADRVGVNAAKDTLVIKKLLNLKKDWIKAIFKREAKPAALAKSTITFNAVAADEKSTVFRLIVSLHEVGNHTPEFQNGVMSDIRKVQVEVGVAPSETAGDLADAVAKALKGLFSIKGKKDLTVTHTKGEAAITIESVDPHVHIEKVELVAVTTSRTGYEAHEARTITVVEDVKGTPGFGNTRWMMANVKLPSLANTHWGAANADERPVPGVEYTQYTIHVCADRPELNGMGAVGEAVASKTTHVLYCDDATATALDAALGATAGIGVTVTTVEDPA